MPQARKAPTAPVPAEDPLADLRDPEALNDTPGPAPAPQAPTRALATQDDQDTARAEVVAAWHADTTATGFLHRGGGCGCRYVAGIALATVLPVQGNDTGDA